MKTWRAWRRWWKVERLYLYVYRCRKPSGWGWHNGYSGITNSPWHRDRQHRSKDWYDLVIRRHCVCIGRMPRGLGLILEYVLIKATLPVYNVQHNRANPRRIKPWTARRQRWLRDHGVPPYAARARDLATLLPVAAFVALAAYLVAVA